MHLEDPVDAQGAVLQMPQGLHHRVVVEDHLLASITRLAPRAEHFLRDLARGGCALQLRGGHGLLDQGAHQVAFAGRVVIDHSAALDGAGSLPIQVVQFRSEEHTSELQSLMRISYAVFCLKKKTQTSTMKN